MESAHQRWFEEVKEKMQQYLAAAWEQASLKPQQLEGVHQFLNQGGTYELFTKIPILNKEEVFGDSDYVQERLKEAANDQQIQVIPSAGSSGKIMSFRFQQATCGAAVIKKLFRKFSWDAASTFFINCYPMGVTLGNLASALECGARPDLLAHALKLLQYWPGKIVIIAQPHFLKYFFDQCHSQTIFPQDFDILLGGSWSPRSFADFLSARLMLPVAGLHGRILSSYGVGELGLGIGSQTPSLGRLRAQLKPQQASLLAESNLPVYPLLLEVDDERYFIEAIDGRLIITPLDGDPRLPLVRYDVGDQGKIFFANDFQSLTACQEALTGKYYLALRGRSVLDLCRFTAENIEEILYHHPLLSQALSPKYSIGSQKITFYAYTKKAKESALSILETYFPQVDIEIQVLAESKFIFDLAKKVATYERS